MSFARFRPVLQQPRMSARVFKVCRVSVLAPQFVPPKMRFVTKVRRGN